MGSSVEGGIGKGKPATRPPVVMAGLTVDKVVVPILVDADGKLAT